MSRIPEELLYTKTHEWVRVEGHMGTVGLTDHAQEMLDEILVVNLPDLGEKVHAYDEVVNLESSKAVLTLNTPLSGTVLAVNEELVDAPSFVNSDPYGDGWLFQLELKDLAELEDFLSPEEYQEHLEQAE